MSTLTFSNVYDTYRQSYLVTSVLPTVLMMSDGGMAKCDLIACVLYIVYPDDDDQDTLFPRWWLRPPVLPCTSPRPPPSFTIRMIIKWISLLLMMMIDGWWWWCWWLMIGAISPPPSRNSCHGPTRKRIDPAAKVKYKYIFIYKYSFSCKYSSTLLSH